MVSVIIPNYNHAEYLKSRLDTVLNQTYQNIEIIILDDASTDNSWEIIQQFALQDSRIITYRNAINSGSPFKQWEKGIAMAKGEFIWIAESDDYCNEKFISNMVSALNQQKDIGLVFCKSYIINSKNEKIYHRGEKTLPFNTNLLNKHFPMRGIEFIKEYLLYSNVIYNASAVLMRKSYYLRSPNINSKLKIFGDWDKWISILLNSKVVFLALPLNYYRFHNQNVRSHNPHKYLIEYINLFSREDLLSILKNEDKLKIADRAVYLWNHQPIKYQFKLRKEMKRFLLLMNFTVYFKWRLKNIIS